MNKKYIFKPWENWMCQSTFWFLKFNLSLNSYLCRLYYNVMAIKRHIKLKCLR